ncbi:MAG: hypothetical protein J5607_10960 [Clostridiales bacterium]|nr:hypothetical protein [Clostridiales bacterium]
MFRSQRVRSAFVAGVLVLSILSGTGCKKSDGTKETSGSRSKSSETTVGSSVSDSESSEAKDSSSMTQETAEETSGSEDAKQDALTRAQELGVKEEELHGEYALFLRYTDCLDQNPNLGTLKDYVLHLFPVVADHLEPDDESFFFQNLSSLRAEIGETSTPSAGEFYAGDNLVLINDKGDTSESGINYTVMYHELMHFIDFSISAGDRSYVYYTGTRFAHAADLTDQEWEKCVPAETDFITEGGADYYTGKYYRKTMVGYDTPASFLSGIEWIYGEETVDRLFFSADSTMEFIRLLEDAGISDQKILDSLFTFNHEAYSWHVLPDHPVRMEDVLVDLYESRKGSGWKEDKVFMQILNEIHACTVEDYPFAHEELKELLLDYPAMEKMSADVLNRIDQRTPQELVRFFKLILLDGKAYLAADLFTSYEFDRNEAISLIVEYDFEKGEVLSYDYYVPDYPKWIN